MLKALLASGISRRFEQELHRSPLHCAKSPAIQQMDDDRNRDREKSPEHSLLEEGHFFPFFGKRFVRKSRSTSS